IGYSGRLITHGDKLYVYRMVIGSGLRIDGIEDIKCLNMDVSKMHQIEEGESLVSLKLMDGKKQPYKGAPEILRHSLEMLHQKGDDAEKIYNFLMTPPSPKDSTHLEFKVPDGLKQSPCYHKHDWIELSQVGDCGNDKQPLRQTLPGGRRIRLKAPLPP